MLVRVKTVHVWGLGICGKFLYLLLNFAALKKVLTKERDLKYIANERNRWPRLNCFSVDAHLSNKTVKKGKVVTTIKSK